MAYVNQFIGYDKKEYDNLKRAINDHSEDITKKINSFNTVIGSLKDHWKGADADKYTKELENVVKDAIDKTRKLYNGMAESFESTYNEWVKKQNS